MNTAIVLIIIILLIIAGYYLLSDGTPDTGETNGEENATSTDGTSGLGGEERNIAYTENGFSPRTINIGSGETVIFTNETQAEMWVASAVHPTHEVYSGTELSEHCPDENNDSFDQCQVGNSFEFTFEKAGTWDYHNHRNATHTGTIIVQ
jgi:plastocyanin